VKYNTYAHMANGIWSSGRTTGRGGMDARRLDIKDATGHWAGEVYEGEMTHGRYYSEDELWENYTHLIRQITPVAEEAGVRIGIHPDDPPVYGLGGIPRCMFGNFAGYQKAIGDGDCQQSQHWRLFVHWLLVRRGRNWHGQWRGRRHQTFCRPKPALQSSFSQRVQPHAGAMDGTSGFFNCNKAERLLGWQHQEN
jgi:hypothetical protein